MNEHDVRARGQVLPIVVIVTVVLFTLTAAAANLLPSHRPTRAQLRAEATGIVVEQRRARIGELRTRGERCEPPVAHELVRLLAMDGQWREAHDYADRYEVRCGADFVVHDWGNAPHAHRR
ncbi:MAG: hypothetical protein ABI591_33105 [Kofleriaceae bacterium]